MLKHWCVSFIQSLPGLQLLPSHSFPITPYFPTSMPRLFLSLSTLPTLLGVDDGKASQPAPSWGGETTSGGWLRSKCLSGNAPTPTQTYTHTHTLLRLNSRGVLASTWRAKQETKGERADKQLDRTVNSMLCSFDGKFEGWNTVEEQQHQQCCRVC